MPEIKQRISQCLSELKGQIIDTGRYIFERPETALEEHQAAARLVEVLREHGFEVTEKAGGLETAFIASKKGGGDGPHVAFLAEYDALPGLGHACGHNLIASCALAAGLALAKALPDFKGVISVFGTPAEESVAGSGKMAMLEAGCFEGVDLCLMAHPGQSTWLGMPFLGVNHIKFSFKGAPAHAAGAPYQGVNAYDAVQLTFTGMSFLRQQLRQDARVHWGAVQVPSAINVIPDFASAEIGVRATDNAYTEYLTQKALDCIKGAALMTGCEADYQVIQAYQAIKVNQTILGLVERELEEMGVTADPANPYGQPGSTDLGNVSQKVPAIHPLYKITGRGAPHTEEFRAAANTDEAYEATLKMASALAKAAAQIVLDEKLLARVKQEFAQS